MAMYSLNSSHISALSSPSPYDRFPHRPSSQRSKLSNQSTSTVQHNAARKVSANSNASLKSESPLRVMNTNVAVGQDDSSVSVAKPEKDRKPSRLNLQQSVHSTPNHCRVYRNTQTRFSVTTHQRILILTAIVYQAAKSILRKM